MSSEQGGGLKIIFFILMFFLSLSAYSIDERDPIIQHLKEKFEQARAPDLKSLHIGKKWVCYGFSVDSFGRARQRYSLQFKVLESNLIRVINGRGR